MNKAKTLFLVIVVPVLCRGQVLFTEYTLDNSSHGVASLYAKDMDADTDLDLLGASSEDHQILWWRNDGGDPIVWTKIVVANFFWGALSVYADDLEGDGDMDIFGAASSGDRISAWRNDGGNPIVWTELSIRSNYGFAHEVYATDVDTDGDADVFAASSDLDEITFWRNDGGNPIVWSEQIISSDFDGAKSVRVADMDGDDDPDIIGAALWDNDVRWWRNDGGDPIQWTEFLVDGLFMGAHRVQAVDMDDDGDTDILAVAYFGHEIAWYRNDGGDPITWTKQSIGTGVINACIAQAADLDNDGDWDVAATGQASDEVSWWRNDGGDPIVWVKYQISNFDRVWPLYIADLDDDGDEDITAASGWEGINEVRWWRNDGVAVVDETDGIIPIGDFRPTCSPNPFNSATVLSFEFRVAGPVNLAVYDIFGRRVAELVNGWRNAGYHEVTFDASGLASGVYIFRLQAADFTAYGKIVLLK